jgi:glutaconate CoA-transferase subunit B
MVTELGVFAYASDGHARLRQLFPDVAVDEIEAATGFELRRADDLEQVPPPTEAELVALRNIDSLNVRRSEFAPSELARTFDLSEIKAG